MTTHPARCEATLAWAASGAMALTGRAGGPPLGPPSGLVSGLREAAHLAATRAAALGGSCAVDPLALLGERAALFGLHRRGPTSCGGATRLLPAGTGWLAVTLARDDDIDLVPAWLELTTVPADPWVAIATALERRPAAEVVERAVLLGIPIGQLPDAIPERAGPVRTTAVRGRATSARPLADLTVVDLTSLWAGPLCGSLLAAAGATVIKVESTTRPDGARRGPAPFFDLMHSGKQSVALELEDREGRTALRALLASADVVLEASRPRALDQLGIDPEALVAAGGPAVWASITGHGRDGAEANRVAFGDDAAVAGGLVAWEDGAPRFCADAVADPATGLVAAAAVLDALTRGGRWLLDIPLVAVAAHLAGPTLPADIAPELVAAPRARLAPGAAPALGAHTTTALARIDR